MKEQEAEWGAWSTFLAGVNVWESEGLPGWQKAQIIAIVIDCYQNSFSFLRESEIVEREVDGALASLARAESAWMFSVMSQLHLVF